MNTSGDLSVSGVPYSPESVAPPLASARAAQKPSSFLDVLSHLLHEVNHLQQNADTSIQSLISGKEGVELHDVMVQLEEAGVAFELMMEIRNKLVDAYQQLLRMQP